MSAMSGVIEKKCFDEKEHKTSAEVKSGRWHNWMVNIGRQLSLSQWVNIK